MLRKAIIYLYSLSKLAINCHMSKIWFVLVWHTALLVSNHRKLYSKTLRWSLIILSTFSSDGIWCWPIIHVVVLLSKMCLGSLIKKISSKMYIRCFQVFALKHTLNLSTCIFFWSSFALFYLSFLYFRISNISF